MKECSSSGRYEKFVDIFNNFEKVFVERYFYDDEEYLNVNFRHKDEKQIFTIPVPIDIVKTIMED